MKSDIEIARECALKPIQEIAEKAKLPLEELEQ
jgi:formyltetrahydrofolate synthetase